MKVVAVSVFACLALLEWWVRQRAFQFLRYKGESRIRANRNLTHLASEHYLPEGEKWLGWLRLLTLAEMVAFIAAFWAVVSSW